MNWQYIYSVMPQFVSATLTTLKISIISIILAILVGLICSILMTYQVRVFDKIAKVYIELSRNTPLLIQLFFLYYGLPKLGIKIDGFTCGVIGLTFLGGSYMAEAFRAGLQSVAQGQIDSGESIGLNRVQVFQYVVFPQALSVSIPAIGANCLFLIKESSVVSAIAVVELLFVTKDLIGMDYKTTEALFLLILSYLIILLPVSILTSYLEYRSRKQAMEFDYLFQTSHLVRLFEGLWVTAKIAFISVFFSAIFGTVLGVIMTSKNILIKAICRLYLEAIRIIPILVLLFVFYFGFATWFNWQWSAVLVCIVVFVLWGTAEMGDLVRAAITSIDQHQKDAAYALGLSPIQTLSFVVFPLSLKRVTPGAINLFTRMIKTSSLAVLIGVVEVIKVGQQIIENSLLVVPNASLWIYGLIFFLYFLICYPLSRLATHLEKVWESR